MVAALSIEPDPQHRIAELLHPDPLPDGKEPEKRLTIGGISWQRYLDLDRALGDERPGPRFYYLRGELEIMTTSSEHERVKKWIDKMVDIFCEAKAIRVGACLGQSTLRNVFADAAAEPDEAWCFGEKKEAPDLVLEIALSSGGIKKLEMYGLRADGSGYEALEESRFLPGLETGLVERCVAIEPWEEARRVFREALRG
jgi:hypothetical protein